MNSVDETKEPRSWPERHPLAWKFLVGFTIAYVSYLIGYHVADCQDRS